MVFTRRWQDHDRYVDPLCAELYARKDRATAQIESGVAVGAKSMDGLYESDFDLFESSAEPIQALRGWIEETLRQAVSIANGQQRNPDELEVEFTEAWAHISNDGGFHDAHYHGNCSWCGIFYVKAAECRPTDETGAGNGISRFYSPVATGGLIEDYGGKYLNLNRTDFLPQDGFLVLFPSYLLHSGLPYRGTADRVLIAFNTKTFVKV